MTYGPLHHYTAGALDATVVDPRFGTDAEPAQPPGWGGGTSGGAGSGSFVSILEHGGSGNGVDDNTAAFNSAVSALWATGGTLFFPPGMYNISGATTALHTGIHLLGTGWDWSAPWNPEGSDGVDPSRGSILRATSAMDRLVQLGNGDGNSLSSGTGSSLRWLSLWGQALATDVVRTKGRRNYIYYCQVFEGASNAVNLAGQNSHVIGGVIANNNIGNCILVTAYDSKIYDAQIRECGPGGALVNVQTNHVMISRNHMYHADGALGLVNVEGSGTLINGNTIEHGGAPEIRIVNLIGLSVNNNLFYSRDEGLHPVISVDTAGGVSDVVVMGNQVSGRNPGGYTGFIRFEQAGTSVGSWAVVGNVGSRSGGLLTGSVPANAATAIQQVANSL